MTRDIEHDFTDAFNGMIGNSVATIGTEIVVKLNWL